MTAFYTRLILSGLFIFTSHLTYASTRVCLTTCIDLPKPALKVVALNWTTAEMLLSLDIVPVGITEGKGYRKWQTNNPTLPDTVSEIGRRQEPNLAAIAKLKPDLIIGYEFRHRHILHSLNQIAPTLLYQQFGNLSQPNFSYFETSQQVFLTIANAVDKTAEAEQIIMSLSQELEMLKQQLVKAGLENKPVSYGKFVGMGYGLRMFNNKSLAGEIAQQLGLQYTWESALPGKDFTHLQLEQLPELHNTHLILAGNQVDSERMMQSPVWPLLPFARQHNLSHVPPLFSFGGPRSSLKMAHAFTDSLLNWQNKTND